MIESMFNLAGQLLTMVINGIFKIFTLLPWIITHPIEAIICVAICFLVGIVTIAMIASMISKLKRV